MLFLLFMASKYFYCIHYPDCYSHQIQYIFQCRAALLFDLVFEHFLLLIRFGRVSFHSVLGTQLIYHLFHDLCLLLFLLYLVPLFIVNLSLLRLHFNFFIFFGCFILLLIRILFFLNCLLLLFHFLFFLFIMMPIQECFRSIIEVLQYTIQNILWIQTIHSLYTISMLINYDDSWICPHLKMLETKLSPIALAVELIKFQVGADFMAAFIIIHKCLNEAAVLAPRRKKLHHFKCILLFYCREY